MLNPMDMTGYNVLITGASSGIGQRCSVLLSELGAKVILVGRNKERLEQTSSLLKGSGHRIEIFDLLRMDEITIWMKEITKITGLLNGLVHCAGVRKTIPLRFLQNNELQNMMNINFNVAVNLIKGFRQKNVCKYPSSIVLISSVLGLVGQPGVAAYSASKSALIGLTKSLALELSSEKIRVNCVVPGYVKSEMFEKHKEILTPEQISQIESFHPLGLGDPIDVAYAVAFLLGDTGKWITGTTLVVDGGYTAH